jgi:hypothetical protein
LSNTSQENANNQVQAGSASTDLVASIMEKAKTNDSEEALKVVQRAGVIIVSIAISQPALFWDVISVSRHVSC